jgi:uncharacterized RDD family membrane protein YckC
VHGDGFREAARGRKGEEKLGFARRVWQTRRTFEPSTIMTWYYAVGSQQQGPVTEDQLQGLIKGGVVTGDTLVWREGMANWLPYRTVSGATPPPPAAASTAVPVSTQTLAFTPTAEVLYAGFWIRFCAKMLDGLVIGIPIGILLVISMVASGAFAQKRGDAAMLIPVVQIVIQLVAMVLSVLYNTIAVGTWGTTLGKKACGLKVIRADGSKPTYGRACGRAFAEILSGAVCYIGYIIAGFDDQKRSLHDHMCDTRVVRDK